MAEGLDWLFSSALMALGFSGFFRFFGLVSLLQIFLVVAGLFFIGSGFQRRLRTSGIVYFFLGLILFILGIGSIVSRQPLSALVPWHLLP